MHVGIKMVRNIDSYCIIIIIIRVYQAGWQKYVDMKRIDGPWVECAAEEKGFWSSSMTPDHFNHPTPARWRCTYTTHILAIEQFSYCAWTTSHIEKSVKQLTIEPAIIHTIAQSIQNSITPCLYIFFYQSIVWVNGWNVDYSLVIKFIYVYNTLDGYYLSYAYRGHQARAPMLYPQWDNPQWNRNRYSKPKNIEMNERMAEQNIIRKSEEEINKQITDLDNLHVTQHHLFRAFTFHRLNCIYIFFLFTFIFNLFILLAWAAAATTFDIDSIHIRYTGQPTTHATHDSVFKPHHQKSQHINRCVCVCIIYVRKKTQTPCTHHTHSHTDDADADGTRWTKCVILYLIVAQYCTATKLDPGVGVFVCSWSSLSSSLLPSN